MVESFSDIQTLFSLRNRGLFITVSRPGLASLSLFFGHLATEVAVGNGRWYIIKVLAYNSDYIGSPWYR
jgi:hypothetical protein